MDRHTRESPPPAATSPSAPFELLIQRIQGGTLELPLLPQTVTQVLALCQDASCDMQELASLIQRDPALAGNVLRVANSSAYAPREPIVSLQQAASRMGFAALCEIATAIAVRGKVYKLPGREAELQELWRHSATSAVWAKEIARKRRRNVEGAFLCGLLHDVGRPVLLQAIAELAGGAHTGAAEREENLLLERFHAELGARLLASWAMPEWMLRAVEHHHSPEGAGEHAEQAWITALADDFGHWTCAPTPAAEQTLHVHPALAPLSLYEEDVSELLARRDTIREMAEAFL